MKWSEHNQIFKHVGEPKYVRSIVVPYVGTVADIPNTHNVLTNIGHRFGHQSALDESSRRRPIILQNSFAFRVYLVIFNENVHKHKIPSQCMMSVKRQSLLKKGVSLFKRKACGKPVQP